MWFQSVIVPYISPIITFCNYLLAFYAGARILMGLYWLRTRYYYNRNKVWEKYNDEAFLPRNESGAIEWPAVTVQLPMYNERNVVERLIKVVAALDYPWNKLQVQVLDDSTDETCQIVQNVIHSLPSNYPIEHIRRVIRTGFKAGAMLEAMPKVTGEFIVVFDADFVPEADFLKRIVVPFFVDRKIGVVQARWEHINEDESLLTKIQSIVLRNHFAFEQFVRSYGNLFLNFNGTCGAWRKSCMEDAGGWHADTLAEDLDLSFRAQFKGWRDEISVPGELPNTVEALKLQQYRWAKGGIQCFKKHIWNVIKDRRMNLLAKFFAFTQLTGYLIYVWMCLMVVLPVIIMPFQPAYVPRSLFFLGIIGPVFALTISQTAHGKPRNLMYIPVCLAMAYGMMFNSLIAVLDGLFRKGAVFARTPKQGQDGNKNDKKAPVKAYKEKHLLYNFPWSESFFLLMSVLVIVKGNVMNPAFYVTHLFYATSYLLMLYLLWFGGPAHEEENGIENYNNSNTNSDNNNSNIVSMHQSDLERGSENEIDKKHTVAISSFKSSKGYSGSSVRMLMQFSFLVFLFYLGNNVANRLPKLDEGIPSWYYLVSRDIPVKELKMSSSCNQSDNASFSTWTQDNFFIMDCGSYPFLYKTANAMKWSDYSQPVLTENEEYIVARCGDKIQFLVRNQINKTANQRALSIVESIYDSSLEDIDQWMEQVKAQYSASKRRETDFGQPTEDSEENSHENKEALFRNINVLNLVVDGNTENSFSLQESRSVLEYQRDIGVIDLFTFKNFIAGEIGDANEIALTSGCLLVPKSSSGSLDPANDETFQYDRSPDFFMMCDTNQKNFAPSEDSEESVWIWNKYQKYGYVTLWGDEESHRKPGSSSGIGKGVTSFFNKKSGAPNDHIYGIHTGERYFVPKCYGEKQLHNDTLSYISTFWKNYKDVGRMAFVHLKQSSPTQQSQSDLDLSLSLFLDKFIQENPDTIINIVGNPLVTLSKKQETNMLTTIISSALLDKFSWMQSVLEANQDKKITSFDFYNSMSSLPSVVIGAFSENQSVRSQALLQLQLQPSWSYNIFTQKIPSSRTCSDAKIAPARCQA